MITVIRPIIDMIVFLFMNMFCTPQSFLLFGLPFFLSIAAQVILCLRTRRLAVRLIPVYIAALVAAAVPALAAAFRWHAVALLIAFGIALLILLGSLIGWVIYGLTRLFRKFRR